MSNDPLGLDIIQRNSVTPEGVPFANDSNIVRGARAGTLGAGSQLQAVTGLVGEAAGADEFAKARYAEAQRLALQAQETAPRITSYKDVNGVRDALDYAGGMVGQSLPYAAIGGAAALATGGGAIPGMLAGATALTPFEAGDIAQRQMLDPAQMQRSAGDRLLDAGLGGAVSAATQAVVPSLVAGKILGRTAKTVAKQGTGKILGRGAADMGLEGVTEGAGEAIKQTAFNPNAALDYDAIAENAVGGLAGGAAMGSIGTGAELLHSNGEQIKGFVGSAAKPLQAGAKSLIGRATGLKETVGEALGPDGYDLGGKTSSFVGSAKDMATKGMDAARAKVEGYDLGQARDDAGAAVDAVTSAFDKARKSTKGMIDRIADSEEFANAKNFVGKQGEALKEAIKIDDEGRLASIRDMAKELWESNMPPERREALKTAMTNLGDRANQAYIASAKKAKDAAAAGRLAVSGFKMGVDRMRAERQADKGDTKKSEDYAGVDKVVKDVIGPFLRERLPHLLEDDFSSMPEAQRNGAREQRNSAINELAPALRGLISEMSADKPVSVDTYMSLLNVAGEHTAEMLDKVHTAMKITDPAKVEAFFSEVNNLVDVQKKHGRLIDTMRESLIDGPDSVHVSDLREAAAEMLKWASTTGPQKDTGSAARQRFRDTRVKDELTKMFGKKADTVLAAVQSMVKQTESRAEKARVKYDEEGNPLGESGGDGLTEVTGGTRLAVYQKKLNLNADDDPGKAGFRPAILQSIDKAQAANPGRKIRYASAEELGMDHPLVKDMYNELVKRGLAADLGLEDAERYADEEISKYGAAVSEASNSHLSMTADELDAVRLDTKAHGRSPSRLEVDDLKLDAVKITRAMAERFKEKDRYSPTDELGQRYRAAHMFMEGIAAVQEYQGKAFDIPDTTVIAFIGKTPLTWGEARKLDVRTDADKSTDAPNQADSAELSILRKQYKAALSKAEKADIVEVAGGIIGRAAERRQEAVSREQGRPDDNGVQQEDPTGFEGGVERGIDMRKKALAQSVRDVQKEIDRVGKLLDGEQQFGTGTAEVALRKQLGLLRSQLIGLEQTIAARTANTEDLGTGQREFDPFGPTFQNGRDLDASGRGPINTDGGEKREGGGAPSLLGRRRDRRPLPAPDKRTAAQRKEDDALRAAAGKAARAFARGDVDSDTIAFRHDGRDYSVRQIRPGQWEILDAENNVLQSVSKPSKASAPADDMEDGPPLSAYDEEGTPSPKVVAAKKAAFLTKARSGDAALIKSLKESTDAKGLQRAVDFLENRHFDAALTESLALKYPELVSTARIASFKLQEGQNADAETADLIAAHLSGSQEESETAMRLLKMLDHTRDQYLALTDEVDAQKAMTARLKANPHSTVGELAKLIAPLLKDEATIAVARAVGTVTPSTTVEQKAHGVANGATGHYAFGTKTRPGFITMFPASNGVHVFLHEAAHAATVAAMEKDAGLHLAFDHLLGHVVKHMPDIGLAYGGTNTMEFIAEGLSNPAFREKMRRIPGSRKVEEFLGTRAANAWEAFVDLMRKALGMDPQERSALAQFLDLSGVAMKTVGRGRLTETGAYVLSDRSVMGREEGKDIVQKMLLPASVAQELIARLGALRGTESERRALYTLDRAIRELSPEQRRALPAQKLFEYVEERALSKPYVAHDTPLPGVTKTLNAINERLGELVKNEDTAYGLGIKKYSLERGEAANDNGRVLSFPDRIGERLQQRFNEIVEQLSQEDFDTLRNDVLARDPDRRKMPSVLKDAFKEWLDDYFGSEREGMMSPERQDETEAQFYEEVADNDGYEPIERAMAQAMLSGAELKALSAQPVDPNAQGLGIKKYSLEAVHVSNERHDGQFNWREKWRTGQGEARVGAGTYLMPANNTVAHENFKGLMRSRMTPKQFEAGGYKQGEPVSYHVSLNAEPHEIMLWDSRFSSQPKEVQEAILSAARSLGVPEKQIAGIIADDPPAHEIYGDDLYNRVFDLRKVSDALDKAGIVGAQYRSARGPEFVIYRDDRISTNAVHFDKTGVDPNAQGPRDLQSVFDYVRKVLGNSVVVDLRANIPHAGEFQRLFTNHGVDDIIRISVHALNPTTVAYHESLHAFFTKLMDGRNGKIAGIVERAASSPVTVMRLRKLLDGQPEAIKQLANAEERAAYMYQFWAAGKLDVAPEPTTIFGKIAEFIRKALGVWSNDERALHVLKYFHSGEFARNMNDPDAVARALLEPGRNAAIEQFKKLAGGIGELGEKLAVAGHQRLRDTGIPALNELADMMKLQGTAEGNDFGFIPAARLEHSLRLSNLGELLHGASNAALRAAMESMQRGNDMAPINALTDRNERAAAMTARATLRQTLDDAHAYMTRAGVDVGDLGVGTDYFPRVWDVHYISSHQREFLNMLERYVQSGDLKGDPRTIMQNLMTSEGTGLRVVDRPGMQHVKPRELAFITADDAARFLNKNLYETMNSYLMQATRRAEWARRFDDDSEKLNDLLDRAGREGATPDDLDSARKYIRSVDGTLGDDIDPTMRRLQGNVIVYQNLRLLPLAIFSSVVDPLGIMVRGGTMPEAFRAFKRGMKEVVKSFQKNPTNDDATDLASILGVIDDASLMRTLGTSYTQGMVGERARKMNDLFFRFNLMEQYNRSMRVGATEAAINFLGRHASGKHSAHSARWMAELGFQPDELRLNAQGRPLLSQLDGLTAAQEAKVRAAINRWVDGAVLRPDAADKPIWMSDPRFAFIAHLKQFVFSFQETILKRAVHELKSGNYSPAYALASYVPVMIAADSAKGLLQGGGSEPAWKRDWTAADYVWSGVERAGLLGVGQFAVDVGKGVRRGESGLGELAGPTLEQLGDAVEVAGGRRAFSSFLLRSMPANALYAEALKGEPVEAHHPE